MAQRPRAVEGVGVTAELATTFRDRPVLVTGHTGFKGSWLALWLAQLGARVTGYALAPPTSPSNFELSHVGAVVERSIEADLRDRAALAEAFASSRPEVVFHLAAQPLVRESYESPRETFDVNVMGTVNVLEAVRQGGRPCVVVVVTSDKCYENREQVWAYREHDALGGFDPYSASKGAADRFFEPRIVADIAFDMPGEVLANVGGLEVAGVRGQAE